VDIEFDPAKDSANIAKHGLSLARAADRWRVPQNSMSGPMPSMNVLPSHATGLSMSWLIALQGRCAAKPSG
jgi:hypothetical protein